MRPLYVCMNCWAAYFPHEAHALPRWCSACEGTIVPTGHGAPELRPTPAEVVAEADRVARECGEALDSLEKGGPK